MESILFIKGDVKYNITLDPGVWIFDDRKVDLDTYFHEEPQQINELEEYTISTSKHWEREIREGAIFPPTLKTEKKFEKEKVLSGTFGIPFKHFLQNAEPHEGASSVIIETETGESVHSLEAAKAFILGFSIKGQPLREDGPVYVYFGDGANFATPIKQVRSFRVE
ncbi:peptidyl-prolyl cis-trans isomerase [Peribacillus glennii]|uniref:Peptidyl-prolyl cis-trans isomerase n=1 Tax=Peribacillus glennii TaxID=2303991 RepID=A0A372LC96_9BACI|nr:peptidyl-prolyl cis-trans isomerase [Peribacillus glennii]RFU63524.1 peptidyl-prolyl cis-trans isomerase [Peribacillus glennii]